MWEGTTWTLIAYYVRKNGVFKTDEFNKEPMKIDWKESCTNMNINSSVKEYQQRWSALCDMFRHMLNRQTTYMWVRVYDYDGMIKVDNIRMEDH